jgi:acetyl esterase/lipase
VSLTYGDHPDQVVDLWRPPGTPIALLVFVHGGFWRAAFDRTHAVPLARDLAGRGYLVALIEYRRVGQPGGGWPGTLDDVEAAVGAAIEAGRESGPVILAGHSAGGHLALWCATRHAVSGVLALAPVADLESGYRLNLGSGAVGAFLGGSPDEVPERYAAADPMRNVPLGVPTVLVHGDLDDRVPVAISRRYHQAARTAGDQVILRELPGLGHFEPIEPDSAAWPAVIEGLTCLGTPTSGGVQ